MNKYETKYQITSSDIEMIRHTANNAMQVLSKMGHINEFNFIHSALVQIVRKTLELDKLNETIK